MTKYKMIETKNGRVQYWVDGKLTAHKDIPASVVGQLEPGTEFEIGAAPVALEPTDQPDQSLPRDQWKCFIDEQPARFKRFLELRTVYLCDDHQHNLTTGEVVFEMRKAGLLSD